MKQELRVEDKYILHFPTFNVFKQFHEIDKKNIGTSEYIGLAFFWNYEYRHYLRDASCIQRQKVHYAFLRAGLNVTDVSVEHDEIIGKILKTKVEVANAKTRD